MSRIVVGREAELQGEREICIKEKQWSCRKSRGAVGRTRKALGRAREVLDEQETCVIIQSSRSSRRPVRLAENLKDEQLRS